MSERIDVNNEFCQSTDEWLADKLFDYCKSDTISEERIREIIELHKESTPDNSHEVSDYQFFRVACSHEEVTEGIIQCLLEYFPEAVSEADDDGLLPLHYACGNNNVSLSIIQLLIDAAPDSVRREDNNNRNLPLHKLCGKTKLDEATGIEILKLLLEKYPESIRHKTIAGYLPIHCAAFDTTKSHEFYRVLIEAYPGSERITDDNGMLPFHHACLYNTVDTVEFLYNLYPDAIHHTTTSGLYPIHTAICALAVIGGTNPNPGARVDIVKFLLHCDPNVKKQEKHGQSLLVYACAIEYESNIGVALEMIEIICDAHPEFVREGDSQRHLPIHKVCANPHQGETTAMAILSLLLKKHPESIQHENYNGHLPIHIAAVNESPEFCRVLIEAYPGSERIPTSEDLLPMHCACINNTVDTVEYLYNLYPDAIDHATQDGFYPIHHAIRSLFTREANPEAAVDIVKFLLDCDHRVKFQKVQGIVHSLVLACFLDYTDTNISAGMDIIEVVYDAHPEAIEDDEIASIIDSRHVHIQEFINSQLVYSRQANDSLLMATPDDDGQLPLHVALQNNVRLGSIKLLAKGNPLAVRSPDNDGALPLHVACMHHESTSVVQYLIELDTTTLAAVDHENNTALHYACCGAKYETITLLLEKYDAVSVSKRNAEGKLPIDALWERIEDVDRGSVEYTESVFRLLRAYPETVMSCM